jgi:hypothetical protein
MRAHAVAIGVLMVSVLGGIERSHGQRAYPLSVAGQGDASDIMDLSSDGTIAVGQLTNGRMFMWEVCSGSRALRQGGSGFVTDRVYGINDEGTFVVGSSYSGPPLSVRGYADYQAGALPASCVTNPPSEDCRVLRVRNPSDCDHASGYMRRYLDEGYHHLYDEAFPYVGNHNTSYTAVVGYLSSCPHYTGAGAYLYRDGVGVTCLNDGSVLPISTLLQPVGVSDDGSVVMGSLNGDCGYWRWTAQTGLVMIPGIPCLEDRADVVSSDGNTLAGVARDASAGDLPRYLWRWDAVHGYEDLRPRLLAAGINLDPLQVQSITDISADGQVFSVRTGFFPCLIVSLRTLCPADVNASDCVDADDIFDFLDIWFVDNGQTASGLAGDFDRSGYVDADDLFAFLDEWFATGVTRTFGCR